MPNHLSLPVHTSKIHRNSISGNAAILLIIIGLCFGGQSALYAQCPITVDAGPDVYLCASPGQAMLDANIGGTYLSFVWTPTTGMTGSNTLTPTVNVSQTTSYILTAKAVNPNINLIDNGDFEQGNSGFSSDYVYNPGFTLFPFGSYEVTATPAAFPDCPDHTSGGGQYMVVDGSDVPNKLVWCQTIAVLPNTDYNLSAWAATFTSGAPFASLKFTINGTTVGAPLSVPTPTCEWHPFNGAWNSGANTSATICIEDITVTGSNNDFAIDDITINPVCTQKDTVVVKIISIAAIANPSVMLINCSGAHVTLSGAGSSTGQNISYLWDTSDGNIVSGANTLSPVVDEPGTYTLTVSYDFGSGQCTKTATVNVILNPNPLTCTITPPLPLGCGGTSVNLVAQSTQGTVNYLWATTNGHIVSGGMSNTAVVDQPGVYTVTVTNFVSGCIAVAQTTVTVANNPPTANATAGGPINCLQNQSTLSGAGSSTGPSIQYAWTTANGLITSGQNMQNAIAGAGGTYILQVTNTANLCVTRDTVTVQIDTVHPQISILPHGQINCLVDTLTLSSTVSPANAQTVWTAGSGGIIVFGDSTQNASVTTAGQYQVTATNLTNGCTSTASTSVIADFQTPTVSVSAADSLTCVAPSVQLSGTGSSSGPSFLYVWTAGPGGNIVSGDSTLTPIVNAAGTYHFAITDTNNGCTASASVSVVADANTITAVANAPDTIDCTTSSFALNTNGSTALANLQYAWSVLPSTGGNIVSGAATANPLVDAPGTYQLMLTNPANGCTATDLAVVRIDTLSPAFSIDVPDTLTCTQQSLTLQAQHNAAGGSFTYNWSATAGGNIVLNPNTLNPTVNAAGTYTLLVSNQLTGCTAQKSVQVIIETGAPVAMIAAPDTLTCAFKTRSLNTTGSSTGSNFQYAWTSAGGGNIVSGANTNTPQVDAPGVYQLLVTNTSNGCTDTAAVAVVQNIVNPLADAGANGLITCAQPQFTLTANNGQSITNLQFTWDTPDGHFTLNTNQAQTACDQAGLYLLTVIDNVNGCKSIDSVNVTANQQAPVFSILPPAVLTCTLTATTLNTNNGGGVYNYAWQTDTGLFQSGQTSASPTVSAPGNYTVTVTDPANGCATVVATSVQQDVDLPVADAGTDATLSCNTTQTNLQGSFQAASGLQLQWTTPDGHIISGANQVDPLVDSSGIYYFNVLNINTGCAVTDSVQVLKDIAPPIVSAGADDTLSCLVNSLTLSGTATAAHALTYAWTALGGGIINSGADTPNPAVIAPGTYVMLATDEVNGCSASDVVVIYKDANTPAVSINTPGILTCAITQLTLLGSGSSGPNFTYSWTVVSGGNIISGENTLAAVIDAPGLYQLQITDNSNGCSATASRTVPQNIAPPNVNAVALGAITCDNPEIQVSGSPAAAGFTFNWQTTDGHIVSGAGTPKPTVDKPGTYTFTATSLLNGCSNSISVEVIEDKVPPIVQISGLNALTCVQKQLSLVGSINLSPQSYTYNWSTIGGHFKSGQNSLFPVVDQPGIYQLSAQSLQNGCTALASDTIVQHIEAPIADAGQTFTLNCTLPSSTLSGTASSGIGNLSYAWSSPDGQITSGANSATPLIFVGGNYLLTVTDAFNGCTAAANVQIGEDKQNPVPVIAPPLTLTCVRDTVSLQASVTQAGTDYKIEWTTITGHFASPFSSLTTSADATGTYFLVITNNVNGCSANVFTTVNSDLVAPDANAGLPQVLQCKQPVATLNGSSTTTAPLNFSWSTNNGHFTSGTTNQTALVDSAGTYNLLVTNTLNGCTATDGVSVTEIPGPYFASVLTQPDCIHPKGSILFDSLGGSAPPYRYSIDNGATTQSAEQFNQVSPGDYTLVMSDKFGCTAYEEVVLDEPIFPSIAMPEFITIELGSSVQLMPQTDPPFYKISNWAWSPAEGLSCTDCRMPEVTTVLTKTYNLVITDLSGCTATADIQVRVDPTRFVYAPNVFSPNGDGSNDFFTIFARNALDMEGFQIFDRWGSLVWQQGASPLNNEAEGWDGRVKGSEPVPGVYIWTARIRFKDGPSATYSGDVTVVK
jgi:gliding motility-associated-like protein